MADLAEIVIAEVKEWLDEAGCFSRVGEVWTGGGISTRDLIGDGRIIRVSARIRDEVLVVTVENPLRQYGQERERTISLEGPNAFEMLADAVRDLCRPV